MVGVGQVARVHDLELLAFFGVGLVPHVGHRGDDGHVEFPFKALLDDFHVEHTEETAPETKPKRRGALRLEDEGRVVELKLFHGGAQLFVIFGVHGVNACEDHGFDILEALHGGLTWPVLGRERVAHLDFFGVFDA